MNNRCFILGNAPSLLEEDLSLIKGEDIFACNRGYKLKELGIDFKYYVLADRFHAKEYHKTIEEETGHAIRYFSSAIKREGVIDLFKKPYKVFPRNDKPLSKFPTKLSDGWGRTVNVITDSIIIAYFLGYKEIYLLGVDLDYSNENNHFYKDDAYESRHKNNVPSHIKQILGNLKTVSEKLKEKEIIVKNLSKGFKHNDYMYVDKLENIRSNK